MTQVSEKHPEPGLQAVHFQPNAPAGAAFEADQLFRQSSPDVKWHDGGQEQLLNLETISDSHAKVLICKLSMRCTIGANVCRNCVCACQWMQTLAQVGLWAL